MTRLSPRYVPPHRARVSRLLIVVLVVLVAAAGTLGFLWTQKKQVAPDEGKTACGLSAQKTRQLVASTESSQTNQVQDYFYYGESLNLSASAYQVGLVDSMQGHTLYLMNLCTNHEYSFFLSGTIDNQILVANLDPGLYAMELAVDLDRYRLVTGAAIQDTFFTVRRNQKMKQVDLISDQSYFDTSAVSGVLDKNYMFLNITETAASENQEVYDVAIDPFGNYRDDGVVSRGVMDNGLVEADEMYQVALKIKEQLESKGLRVLLLRNNADEVVNIYGKNGRIDRALSGHAKLYLDIQLNAAADTTATGGQITYSAYSSNRFASTVFKQLQNAGLNLPRIDYGTGDNDKGVLKDSVTNGYDDRSSIRETGGYGLGAGSITNARFDFIALNEFLKTNRHGSQTVSLEYFMISNPQLASLWTSERDQIGIETANGILSYLGVK